MGGKGRGGGGGEAVKVREEDKREGVGEERGGRSHKYLLANEHRIDYNAECIPK